MLHQISWCVPKRVYLIVLGGIVSIDEISTISDESISFLRSGDAPVHSIVDVRNVKLVEGLSIGKVLSNAKVFREPNLGWTLMVSRNRYLPFIGSTVTRFSKKQFAAFDNLDDAFAKLWELDSTLGEISDFQTIVQASAEFIPNKPS